MNEEALYNLNFDVFQRFRGISAIIESLNLKTGARILDVGGYPGILADIITPFEVVTLDRPECSRDNYVSGSGTEIPFADGSFELVISSDTLEHILPDTRPRFLEELTRVSSDWVVVGAPFDCLHVRAAEEELNELYRVIRGKENPWLKEHIGHGLPVLDETVGVIEQCGLEWVTVPNGDALSWSLAMNIQVVAEIFPESLTPLNELNGELNRLWEDSVIPNGPSYRHILVARPKGKGIDIPTEENKGADSDSPEQVTEKIKTLGRFIRELARGINAALELSESRDMPMSGVTYINQIEKIVRLQESDIKNLKQENDQLAQRLGKYDANALIRIARKFKGN